MRHLPVENSHNLRRVKAVQHVLWSEVSMDDHLTRTIETGNDGRVNRLKLGQPGPGHSQDHGSATLVDEFLAMTADDFFEEKHGHRRVELKDFRHGITTAQSRQTSEL